MEHHQRSGIGNTTIMQYMFNWPVASWSSIDYHGRWKALHYMAKKFFSPLLISGLEDMEQGTVEIHLTSDLYPEQLEVDKGLVTWTLTDVKGDKISADSFESELPFADSHCVKTLE